MSKEEILDAKAVGVAAGQYTIDCDKAHDAMDQYAKEQCIAFSEWMVKCQWSPIVTSVPGPPIYAPEDSDQRYTTEQLYQLFLNHQSTTT